MKLSLRLNIADLFLVIWMIERTMKFTGRSGDVTVALLMVLILWSMYNMYELHSRGRATRLVYAFDSLCGMFTIYGLILLAIGEKITTSGMTAVNNRDFLLNIYMSLLPFYTFYRYTIIGKLNLNKIFLWTIPFFVIAYLDYKFQFEFALVKFATEANMGNPEDVVNNGSYAILGLLPLICLFKRRIIQMAAMIFCVFFIATAFKRGPIIIMTVFFLYYLYISSKSLKKNKWLFIAVPLLLYAVAIIFMRLYLENDLFQYRIEKTLEGSTSGRDVLASNIINYYLDQSNVFQLIFGYGANAAAKYVGNAAHSDWLEILFCHGVMGVVIYFLYWKEIIRYWRNSEKGSVGKLATGTFVIIYFLKSIFSMSYAGVPYYAMIVFAFYAAQMDKEKVLRSLRKAGQANIVASV